MKINNIGWYLLSTAPNQNLKKIVDTYGYPSYLDISVAYVPLYSDISSQITDTSDFSFNINSNTTTNINSHDLSFNYTLGNVIDSNNFKKPFLGKINNFDHSFNDSFGIWVYMYNPITFPILEISLNNIEKNYNNIKNKKRPIIKLTINDVSDINILNDNIKLNFTQDSSVNIVFERSFDFSFNNIFNYIVKKNEFITFNIDNSNTLLFSTNFSGTDFNQTLNTSSLDTSADISFTVFNSNPIQLGQKFTVNFRIDISDTIYPSIDFNTLQPQNSSFNFSNSHIFTNINNNVNVSIPQSIIRSNMTTNYRPNALFFDQNQRIVNIESFNISNLPSSIRNPNTLSNETISYETGTWWAGIYNFRYECTDLVNKITVVNLSLEIIDDLQPTINITNSNSNTTINAYLTNAPYFNTPNRNHNNYNTTNIPINTSFISGVGFTLSNIFINTNNDFDDDSTRYFHFYLSELSGNSWYFPDITSVIDWSNVDININNVIKFNLPSSRWTENNLKDNFFTTDSNNFNNALRQTTFNNNNPNIQRTYQVSDNNHILTDGRKSNNTTTLTTQYFIWDDTIPIVDVSFIHTIFKIDTSQKLYNAVNNQNNVYGDLTSILDTNEIQSNPIVINLYDDIEFKFSMNKECMCKVDLLSHSIIPNSNDYQFMHTIYLNHTHTSSVGTHDLIFTIWDKNNNFFKFKYNISINDIPSYTLKIIQDEHQNDTNKKQKLLLRVANRSYYESYFVFMRIKTDQSSWDMNFTNLAFVYNNELNLSTTHYQKIFIGTTGFFSFGIKGSGYTQNFNTDSIDNGIYYEILYFPDSPNLNIEYVYNFWIDSQSREGNLAQGEGNYTDISNNIGFYNNDNYIISYNES